MRPRSLLSKGALWMASVGGLLLLSACHDGPHRALTVTSTADAADAAPGDGSCDDGTGACTLRAAVDEANALAGDDVQIDVVLPAGTYPLAGPSGDDANVSGDLDVAGRISLQASGPAVIDAGGVDRALDVQPGGVLGLDGVTVTGGRAGAGGGLRVAGQLLAGATTLTGNVATAADGGGGLLVADGGTAILHATTVSGNEAFAGAGVATTGSGRLIADFVTITDNDGGGLALAGPGSTLRASLVVDQAAGADCTGAAVASEGGNVDSDATCLTAPAAGDAPGAPAPLGPLGDHGGRSPTHLPQPGSAAHDRVAAGSPGCGGGDTDQRAALRPKEGGCEAGAVEVSLAEPGSYTLYAVQQTSEVDLVDADGDVVHRWTTSTPVVNAPYLLPGGRLLRVNALGGALGRSGTIEILSWDGAVEWSWYSPTYHHDLEPLPDGNVLMVGATFHTTEEIVGLGRDPAIAGEGLWAPEVLELDPDRGADPVVWRWSALDHTVQDHDPVLPFYGSPADHPERIDLNVDEMEVPVAGATADWVHVNGIDHSPELDQIAISSRSFSEVWVIDHATTTGEAASHFGGAQGRGGDLLYRWGNPQMYGRGTAADQQLFRQHDATWVPTGDGGQALLVFNNGTGRPGGDSSSVDEWLVPVAPDGSYPDPGPTAPWGPTAAGWSWSAPDPGSFFEPFISGAQRTEGGNTLVVGGWSGQVFEVAPDGTEVFRIDPGPTVFKARRYVDLDGTEPAPVSLAAGGGAGVLASAGASPTPAP